uniref:Ribonuclease H-like domain-containing protein n=1 Tax=Tanacetum cinerariifolium TaxID=118510 RepID=A0A699HG28_TANCI|nr:ribonuclease H-like domain-containing protein [Tanacetum cinerariifolium]
MCPCSNFSEHAHTRMIDLRVLAEPMVDLTSDPVNPSVAADPRVNLIPNSVGSAYPGMTEWAGINIRLEQTELDGSVAIEVLYGLKQAPRAWFQRFTGYAFRVGFSSSHCDSSLFIYSHVTEKKYALELLDRAHMATCNSTRTQIDTKSKLGFDGDHVSDPTLYHSLASGLQYLTSTRPDISYAVQHVCIYMHDPQESHFAALKRILRYIRGTLKFGLQVYASSMGSLVAYYDVDWAGCSTAKCSVNTNNA